jgi:hypothetical protein
MHTVFYPCAAPKPTHEPASFHARGRGSSESEATFGGGCLPVPTSLEGIAEELEYLMEQPAQGRGGMTRAGCGLFSPQSFHLPDELTFR